MIPVAPNLCTTANMTRTTAPKDNVATRKRQRRHARVPAALRLAPVRAALATSLTCATIVAPIRAVDSHSIASAIVAAAEATLIAATAPHGAPLALARCRHVVLSVSVRCLRRVAALSSPRTSCAARPPPPTPRRTRRAEHAHPSPSSGPEPTEAPVCVRVRVGVCQCSPRARVGALSRTILVLQLNPSRCAQASAPSKSTPAASPTACRSSSRTRARRAETAESAGCDESHRR